jgi:hypothetical protein
MRRAQMDTLRAQQSLSHSFVERASIAVQLLDLEKESRDAEINERVRRAERDHAEGKITEAVLIKVRFHAEQLKFEADVTDSLERRAIMEEEELERQQEFEKFEEQRYDAQRTILQAQLQLATTAEERRKIEMDILNLAYRERKERLERIIQQSKDEGERTRAELELAGLGREYGLDRAGVMASTRGPLEEWAASVPQTAAQINEAFQSIQAEGLEGLSTAIADVITGARSLKEAFGDLAKSIIADIIQMTVRMLIFRAVSGIMGGAMGGSSPGNDILVTGLPSQLPQFATGGGFNIKGRGGTDRNVLSLNGLPIARVSHGERISIANDNVNGGGGATVVQNISFSGAVDLATKQEVYRVVSMIKPLAEQAVRERGRRNP